MKKSTVLSFIVATSLFGLCGCASNQGQNNQSSQPKPAADNRTAEQKLKAGMTEDEVRAAIGNPKTVLNNDDGTVTWVYNDSEKAFIPFYTISGGKFHHVTVNFDKEGKVKSWSSGDSTAY